MDEERTILIVDDAPMFLEIEGLFLARSGRVVTAQSGEEALARARRESPDLMLVDAYMPGMSGADVCRAVRSDPQLSDTPIIALCSSDEADERAAILRAGADDVLSKPIDRMALVESVQRPLAATLERRGVEVILTPLRQCRTLGGGLHCVTLDLRRRGTLERYD